MGGRRHSPASRPRRSSGATVGAGGRSRASRPPTARAACRWTSRPSPGRARPARRGRRGRQRRGAPGRGAHRAGGPEHRRRPVRAPPERRLSLTVAGAARRAGRAARHSSHGSPSAGRSRSVGPPPGRPGPGHRGRGDPRARPPRRSWGGRSRAGRALPARGAPAGRRPADDRRPGRARALPSRGAPGGRRGPAAGEPRRVVDRSGAGPGGALHRAAVPAPADIGLGSRKGVVLEWPTRPPDLAAGRQRAHRRDGTFAIPWSFALRGLTIPMRASVPTEVGWPSCRRDRG